MNQGFGCKLFPWKVIPNNMVREQGIIKGNEGEQQTECWRAGHHSGQRTFFNICRIHLTIVPPKHKEVEVYVHKLLALTVSCSEEVSSLTHSGPTSRHRPSTHLNQLGRNNGSVSSVEATGETQVGQGNRSRVLTAPATLALSLLP